MPKDDLTVSLYPPPMLSADATVFYLHIAAHVPEDTDKIIDLVPTVVRRDWRRRVVSHPVNAFVAAYKGLRWSADADA